jgi:hypothetical protein
MTPSINGDALREPCACPGDDPAEDELLLSSALSTSFSCFPPIFAAFNAPFVLVFHYEVLD